MLYARYHREEVSTEFAQVINEEARTPADVRKAKEELAEMDLSREQLRQQLAGRAKFVTSLKSEEFYLSIDTKQRKLRFYYGGTVLREADILPGEARTVEGKDKQWTFVLLKGAFPVEAKIVGYAWRVPEWVYAMKNEPVPPDRPVVQDGLGKYVIFLPNGYAIHSQPSADSPLQGPKPGSYMVSEDVLRAIWPRIHKNTPVYIF